MKRFFALTLILAAMATSALAGDADRKILHGQIVRVVDGDTVVLSTDDRERVRVRLYGIDCPEKAQPGGPMATAAITRLANYREADVEVFDTDKYGRAVGVISLEDGRNVNRELVRDGFAWVYPKYCREDFCDEWQDLEDRAKTAREGIFANPHAAEPWKYRKTRSDGKKQGREG